MACSNAARTCRKALSGSTCIPAIAARWPSGPGGLCLVSVGNDGNMGGVAEAQRVRGSGTGTVLMLAPGSGLGCAYIDRMGLPLDGDSLAGMEASHMPAPLHLLGVPAYPCGCGRSWGCIEVYTTLSGLPHLLADKLKQQPNHELASSPLSPKERALALRGLAQQGDPLAVELFDFQARALGIHIANLAMALDPQFVVIGGGLMDQRPRPRRSASATSRSCAMRPRPICGRRSKPSSRSFRPHWATCRRRLARRWWRCISILDMCFTFFWAVSATDVAETARRKERLGVLGKHILHIRYGRARLCRALP